MELTLIRERHDTVPALDTAVSRQILEEVADGMRPDTFRLHQAPRVVAFGRQDVVASGYPAAVRAAAEHGFAPVERLAGGRAAVFHEGTLAFAMAQAVPDPRLGVTSRFEHVATLLQDALRLLGVDAHVGELPGEYCPGKFSIHAAGSIKIVGIGQRLIRGASHVGGVLVVRDSSAIRRVLTPVYAALDLSWDPKTAGAVEDVVPGTAIDDAAAAVVATLGRHYELVEGTVGETTVTGAQARLADHQPGGHVWHSP